MLQQLLYITSWNVTMVTTRLTIISPFSNTSGENLNWLDVLFTKLDMMSSLSPSGGIRVICYIKCNIKYYMNASVTTKQTGSGS